MKLPSLFALTVFLLCTRAYSVNSESEAQQNVTVPKSPTVQMITEPHALAEPPKQNDTKTISSTTSSSSTTTPGVVGTPPIPKSTVTTNVSYVNTTVSSQEMKHKGREGVINEQQEQTSSKPESGVHNATTLNGKIETVLSTPMPNKVQDPKGSSNNSTLSGSTTSSTAAPPTVNATSSSTSTSQPTSTTKTTTTTTTTSTTTTTTTTTTTPKPKKPTVTYSIEDQPSIANVTRGKIHDRTPTGGKLNVEMPDAPVAQPSMDVVMPPIHRDYFISVVAIVFAVPIIMGAMIVMVRRFKDYWSTRHYRRMDFLVDGMYND